MANCGRLVFAVVKYVGVQALPTCVAASRMVDRDPNPAVGNPIRSFRLSARALDNQLPQQIYKPPGFEVVWSIDGDRLSYIGYSISKEARCQRANQFGSATLISISTVNPPSGVNRVARAVDCRDPNKRVVLE